MKACGQGCIQQLFRKALKRDRSWGKNTFVQMQGKKQTKNKPAANIKTETRFQESFYHKALREKHGLLFYNYDPVFEKLQLWSPCKEHRKAQTLLGAMPHSSSPWSSASAATGAPIASEFRASLPTQALPLELAQPSPDAALGLLKINDSTESVPGISGDSFY